LRELLVAAVPVLIGAVLIVAAGLKLAGLAFSPVPAVGPFSSPRLSVGIATWELLLGAWLLSGHDRGLAWFASAFTFLSFAIASGYMGIIGVSSCGCFGVMKASPWAAFAVDVAMLAVLAVFRPSPLFAAASIRSAVMKPGFAILVVIGVTAGLLSWTGHLAAGLAALRGETVSLSTSYLDFGIGEVGDNLHARMTVTNHNSQPLRIVGGTSDCSCTTTDSLPVTIEPGATADIPIKLHVPNAKPGQMTRTVILRTDNPDALELRLHIGCVVR
jgi:hypothetical protein